MNLYKITFVFFIAFTSLYHANSQYWEFIPEHEIQNKDQLVREIIPSEYKTIQLDLAKIKKLLSIAPQETNKNAQELILDFPMPNGKLEPYRVVASSVMMPKLSAKFSDINSYKIFSTEDKFNNGRLDISKNGIRAAFRTRDGQVYIDPYANDQIETYITYFTKNHEDLLNNPKVACGVNYSVHAQENEPFSADLYNNLKSDSPITVMRNYRIAFACTGEWGAGRGSVENAISLMNTGINRLNLIFENELSIRLHLIDNNDKLIHLDGSSDPYNNANNGASLIGQNTFIVNSLLDENEEYEVGHIFALCTDVGGIASLGSMCNPVSKASGATCFFGGNVTGVVVNITAHELGHQMDAHHTFNNCGGNESQGNGFEPGSGSTIMSYAGLCGGNNVVNTNFDTYHVHSIQQIYQHTRNGGPADECSMKEETGNHEPDISIDLENGFYIPIRTPFELTGIAEDCDDDPMTYSWEQYNFGPITPLGNPVNNSPLFEVLRPSESKTRVFPRLTRVISNSSNSREVLPAYSRDLNFRFVVRDNHPNGGTVVWDEVSFYSTIDAGPFRVEYPNSFEEFETGQKIAVTWDVANTDGPLVNCQKVNIFLSYNSGSTRDYLLAENVANDGSHEVILPNVELNLARIIIKAADNIFFDMSNADFLVKEPTTPGYFTDIFPKSSIVCLPEQLSFNIETAGYAGYSEDIHLEIVSGLPIGAIASFSANDIAPGTPVTLALDLSNVNGTGDYVIKFESTSGTADPIIREITLSVTGTDFSALNTVFPETNQAGVTITPDFIWEEIEDAESYTIEVATGPEFGNSTIIYQEGLSSNSYLHNNILDINTLYYWRVKAENVCKKGDFTSISAFGTEVLSCSQLTSDELPINISATGFPTIQNNILSTLNGQVSKVIVGKLKGTHERISDLEFILQSPSGEEIILLSRECGNNSNFNLGFNDQAIATLDCPMTTGFSYLPVEPLANFIGEEAGGLWKLIVNDKKAGAGGNIQNINLEICSNVAPNPPLLINNFTLQLPPNSRDLITHDDLLAEDADNTAEELIYTLVKQPAEGALFLFGVEIQVGDQFSQEQINGKGLKYKNYDNSSATEDQFLFTVTDGQGGWIGITQFNIDIDESFTSNTKDEITHQDIILYPNPSYNDINVSANVDIDIINIYNVNGALVRTKDMGTNKFSLSVREIPNGLYFVEYLIGNQRIQDKFVKIQR